MFSGPAENTDQHDTFVKQHAQGYWRKAAVVSWTAHCSGHPEFDFHKYMMRTLEVDFKKIVGISWYLWLFVLLFLLLNVRGWHMYFWLSFLPVVLLLLVGAKLEHIIVRLAQEADETKEQHEATRVKPCDELFWFKKPGVILHLIHFILFENAFELAFFFWILCNGSSCMQPHHLAFVCTGHTASEKGSSTGRNATQIDRIAKESNESLRTEEQATISVVSQGFQYYLPVFLEKF
ncbi:hypothetical protein V6N13_083927 [Hibiscus sabdariffa]